MPAADETEVVLAPLAGPALAEVVRAAWDAGEAIAPINPRLTAPERAAVVDLIRPTQIHDADGRRSLDGGAPTAADVVAILTTSGTAGAPKGVELTRPGMEVMGRGYSAGVRATTRDNWLVCLPLHHVASLGVLARSYVTGVPYTVHEQFDAERVARSHRAEGTTIVSLVPTTLLRLLDAGAPLHEYRVLLIGGAPCPASLRTRAEATGATVVDAYGLTETWSGCALDGRAIEGADIRVDPNTGEVLVKGAMVMRGYRFDAAHTSDVLEADGTFHTGDVGVIERGRLRVVDRLKDIVITGAVNVSPTEVESVLLRHDAIDDVCVIGVPDDEWGERVVAVVVSERPPTVDELRAFAREELSAAKLPKEVRVVAEIPRSNSGKPLRRVLRGEA
jgi:O-succinylbenzoic acid--CoA ligase